MGSTKHASRQTKGPGPIGANGDLRQDWRRLSLTDAVGSGDPGSRLTSVTDLGPGSGIQFVLTGSWGSTDWAGAYPYWTFRLPDFNGRWWRQSTPLSPMLLTRIRTAPGDSSDYAVYACITNEADITSATVDGKGGGLTFATATRTFTSTRLNNGAVASATGGAATTNASMVTTVDMHGTNRIAPQQVPVVVGLDSADAYNSTTINNGATGTLLGSGDLFIAIAVGRTAAGNAAAATAAFDFYVPPMFPVVYPP